MIEVKRNVKFLWFCGLVIELLVISFFILFLVGWTFGMSVVNQLFAGTIVMLPITLICFVLVSISLLLLKSFSNIGYSEVLHSTQPSSYIKKTH